MLQLIPNPWTLLFQVVNFLIFAYVLTRFVFRPLIAKAEARAEEREALFEEARQVREESQELRETWEARVEQAEEEAASIIEEAQQKAEKEREAVLQEAQEEVERIMVEAHADAARMRQQALEEFREELIAAVLDVSGVVIRQLAPDTLHAGMVQQLSDRIWEMGRSEMGRVEDFRRSLGERTPTAHVKTAHSLSQELRGNLARTLSALADRNVNLEIEVDPGLVAGVRLRLGDLVIENSIAGELNALENEVSTALRERLEND